MGSTIVWKDPQVKVEERHKLKAVGLYYEDSETATAQALANAEREGYERCLEAIQGEVDKILQGVPPQ